MEAYNHDDFEVVRVDDRLGGFESRRIQLKYVRILTMMRLLRS